LQIPSSEQDLFVILLAYLVWVF